MSYNNVYEYIQGEFQAVTRVKQEPVTNSDIAFFRDLNLVKWAGYNIQLWTAETGGTQLVQGLDYTIQLRDNSVEGPLAESVYAGYSILTPTYFNVPLYMTADIVGAYTTRPYRPSYNVITADTTVTPANMDDSVIADATSGSFTVTIANGFHLNQRYSIICKGLGTVTVVGTGISAASFTGVGVSWLWDGNEWMPLAAPGAREGGIYYDWELVYTNEGAPSTTIPNVSTYGEGLLYAGVEFTYGGESVRASGTFALYDDGIDRYTILANDVSGSDSTMNLRYDAGTDTLEAVETGNDFTNINLFALYHWTEYTFGGFGAWGNTVEAPPYGEAITSEQELYLDGTKEFVSSDGNAPVVDVVDYLPAVINVDGSETPEANSKWPGNRGTYGFFDGYENDWETGRQEQYAELSSEGDWNKIISTADSESAYSRGGDLSNGVTSAYGSILIRNGNMSINTRVQIIADSASAGVIDINWGTKTFIPAVGAIDNGSIFITDDTVLVKISSTFTASTSNSYFRIQISAAGGSTQIGDYIYWKDPMIVSGINYPVPYTAGVHPASKLQFNKDWASSTEWTFEGYVKIEADLVSGFQKILFCGDPDGSDLIVVDCSSTGAFRCNVKVAGVGNQSTKGPMTQGQLHHWKAVVTTTEVTVWLDGAPGATVALPSVDFGAIEKTLSIGYDPTDPDLETQGYIQDLVVNPIADTSDAHYLAQLPYYNPNKTYGKNASWSIDSRGNISGNNQVSGSIIQDEEINGQWVTRWDTGRMVVNGEYTGGGANPVGVLFNPPFSTGNYSMNITCNAATPVMAVYSGKDVGSVNVHRFTDAGAAVTSSFIWTTTGRWK